MRTTPRTIFLAAAFSVLTAFLPALHAAAATGTLIKAADADAAWVEAQRKTYPLTTCLVSDERLGGMGKPADYAYRVEGEPDRFVRFCCSGCDEDFLAAPDKFLAKVDGAKTEAGKSATVTAPLPGTQR